MEIKRKTLVVTHRHDNSKNLKGFLRTINEKQHKKRKTKKEKNKQKQQKKNAKQITSCATKIKQKLKRTF